MLDEAPESMRQFCKFFLKTSKVIRNDREWDFDLPLIKAISVGYILLKEALRGLPISWEAYEIMVAGRGEVGIALSSFRSNFY